MDPITHAALGIAAGVAAAPRKANLRHAALAGLAGGWLPDLDIFFRVPGDPLAFFRWHRHFTHSFVFSPVLALAGAGLACLILIRRRPEFRTLLIPAWAGVISHLLNDAATTYGTLLRWPFDTTRDSWDIFPIVDPVCLTLPVLFIGLAGVIRRSRVAAFVALGWTLAYGSIAVLQHERAASALKTHLAGQNTRPGNLVVSPAPFSLLLWRGVYESEGRHHAVAIRPRLFSIRLWPGESAPSAHPGRDGIPGPETPAGRVIADLYDFSGGRLRRQDLPDGSVFLGDARFSSLPHEMDSLWGVTLRKTGEEYSITPGVRHRRNDLPFGTFFGMVFDNENAPDGAVTAP